MNMRAIPTSESEVGDVVRQARADGNPLEIRGGGTRRALGRPVQAASTLSLEALTGVTVYEPGALTLIARAGTPLSEVEETLKSGGQRLAFEPMDHRALLGSDGEPTIGGVVACNISGPRRIQAGACRDSLIGVRYVDGAGEIIKNGGRVMKNVTGYDLVKLMCGSWGTLGVLTEVAFKVLPAHEREATLSVGGLSTAEAVGVMSDALGSPFDVTGAAHLPDRNGAPQTIIRVEGLARQVDYRLERLREIFANCSDLKVLDGDDHHDLWRRVRDVVRFQDSTRSVWRLSVKPSDAVAIESALRDDLDADAMFDWGGGLIWVEVPDHDTARTAEVRAIVARFGGHATLVRAPETVRAFVDVFQPQIPGLASVSRAIREKFDPDNILNPGRMTA